jgi:hypothetical protein
MTRKRMPRKRMLASGMLASGIACPLPLDSVYDDTERGGDMVGCYGGSGYFIMRTTSEGGVNIELSIPEGVIHQRRGEIRGSPSRSA